MKVYPLVHSPVWSCKPFGAEVFSIIIHLSSQNLHATFLIWYCFKYCYSEVDCYFVSINDSRVYCCLTCSLCHSNVSKSGQLVVLLLCLSFRCVKSLFFFKDCPKMYIQDFQKTRFFRYFLQILKFGPENLGQVVILS